MGKRSCSTEHTGHTGTYQESIQVHTKIIRPQIIHPPHCTRARWDLLIHLVAIPRQSSLEESLISLGHDELWAWLTDALRQLGDMVPTTVDPGAVAAQTQGTVTLTLASLSLSLHLHFSSLSGSTSPSLPPHLHHLSFPCSFLALLPSLSRPLEREWEEVC